MSKPTKSPLEKLVQAAQEKERREKADKKNLLVKLEPKNRLKKKSPKVLIPIIEDELTLVDPEEASNASLPQGMMISNSSLTFNLNFNIDDTAVDKAIQTSKQVAKGIAAAGAAILGTAFLMNNTNKVVDKIKIPVTPKAKLPKIKKPAV
jgi:hypothetical protein